MSRRRPGFELPLLLLRGFRELIDDLHVRLAQEGHPDVRPLHGFVFQAIGVEGITAVELGRRLGVSKQAAGKMIVSLEGLGYVRRESDPHDRRRKVVRLTDRGVDCLLRSAIIFDDLRDGWAERLGAERVRMLEDALAQIAPGDVSRLLDVPGWFARSE